MFVKCLLSFSSHGPVRFSLQNFLTTAGKVHNLGSTALNTSLK